MHQDAIDADASWIDVWELFFEDPWFRRRLDFSARKLISQYQLPPQWIEDVKQEAVLIFSQSIRRDRSLRFDPNRGSFGAFISTIIYRCCQKALRQFNQVATRAIDESVHPVTEFVDALDEQLDFYQRLDQLPTRYQTTLKLFCAGKTIPEIAVETNRSARTIYRWIDKATDLIRKSWQIDSLDGK